MTDANYFIDNDLRITCADAVELVTDYLDDALASGDLENFETHLSLCEGCQAFVDQLNTTIVLTAGTRPGDGDALPSNFSQLVHALEQSATRLS